MDFQRGLIAGHIADRQPEHQLSDTGLIVTRNGYGAQVANVNKIAIVDVDHADLLHHHYPDEYDENGYMTELAIKQSSPTGKVKVWFFVLAFVLIASVIAWLELSWLWLIAVMVAVTAYLWQQASKKDKARTQKRADDTASLQPLVVDLVRKRVATHSHEQFRLYETPEGFRLIATHDNIEPSDALVAEWFEHFHADANYVRLCQAQCCFRARLTAKPWRMAEVNEKGTLNKNIPTKDFWSMPSDDVDSEENEWRHAALEAREKWLADYDKYAKNYRACRYIETYSGREATRFGVAASDISTQALTRAAINGFIRWHDDACQVDKDLDLA